MARPRKKPDDEQPNDLGEDSRSQSNDQSNETTRRSSRSGRRSSPESETEISSPSSTSSPAEDPFAVEQPPPFAPGDDGKPRLEPDLDDDLDVETDLFLWTPERAGAGVRIVGHVLHAADRFGHVDGGEELWKATEQDAADIGPPLARMLNRYEPTRRLAGRVDEAELTAALYGYVRRNLVLRGRLVRQERARAETEAPRVGATAFEEMAGDQHAPPPTFPVEDGPVEFVDEREDPSQPEPYAFDPWAAR